MYQGCTVTKTSHLPIRYLLALLWAHPILHISTIRVNKVKCFDNFVYVLQNITRSEGGWCPIKHSLCILVQTDPSSSLSVVYDVKLMHVFHVVNMKWFNIIINSNMIILRLFKWNNPSNSVFSCFHDGILHFAELVIWYIRLVSRTDVVFQNEPIPIVRRNDGERL